MERACKSKAESDSFARDISKEVELEKEQKSNLY
jgi:hypothetical protein